MIKLGLLRITQLCKDLGNPQNNLKFVHIAGTNGKGSTGAFIVSILKDAGYKTGWYSSPAVFSREEVIRINSRAISKKDYDRLLNVMDNISPEATEFEKETAIAFTYFNEKKCDIVVLECGMGGETDATNVVENTLAAVLTPISMDHMDYLGDTLEKIARVKAGIIKDKSCVILAPQSPTVLSVIKEAAEQKDSRVLVAPLKKYSKNSLGLYGINQNVNASVAESVTEVLNDNGFKINKSHIDKGLKNVKLEGRFEVIKHKPTIILDGGHNEAAAICIRDNMMEYFKDKKVIHVVGMLVNKDHSSYMKIMSEVSDVVLTVSTSGDRGYSAENLAKDTLLYKNEVSAIGGIEEALDIAYLMADKKDVILISGTFTILDAAKRWLKLKNIPVK